MSGHPAIKSEKSNEPIARNELTKIQIDAFSLLPDSPSSIFLTVFEYNVIISVILCFTLIFKKKMQHH